MGGNYGDRALTVCIDSAGCAYIAGYTMSDDFPITQGAFCTTFNGGNFDMFVVKLKADGSGADYSTYIGGNASEEPGGICVDAAGCVYLTGWTESPDFPTTTGAYDTIPDTNSSDAFILKLAANGSEILYSTVVGAHEADLGTGIAVDGTGSAYVVGGTSCGLFPTTGGAIAPGYNGGSMDVFALKMSPDGSSLVYSTFLGGDFDERAADLDLDASGCLYVTGNTVSNDFPTTSDAFCQTRARGSYDVFLSKISPNGSTLLYSTYLGGRGSDRSTAVRVDSSGSAHVVGITADRGFPVTPGAWDTHVDTSNIPNPIVGFLTKFNHNASTLEYSSFIEASSGTAETRVYGLALYPGGMPVVTGSTSPRFPTTSDAVITAHQGMVDAFVLMLDATGSYLRYSTYIGGSLQDAAYDVEVSAPDKVVLVGFTDSPDFPVTAGAWQVAGWGQYAAFATKIRVNPGTVSLPGPPQALQTTDGDRAVSLLWDPPQNTGGYTVKDFVIHRGTSSTDLTPVAEVSGETDSYDDDGLVNGRTYYYAVSAKTAIGSGSPCAPVEGTPFGTPTSPRNLRATAGNRSVDLVWDPPSDNGGYPVLGYKLYRGLHTGNMPHVGTLLNVTTHHQGGLTAGVSYFYRVRAFTERANGEGSFVTEVVPFGPPGKPADLEVQPGDNMVLLSWRPPSNDGDRPILGYMVYKGQTKQSLAPLANVKATDYLDKDVVNGREYFYKVQARNEVGDSKSTSIVGVMPMGPPGVPTNLTIEPADGMARIHWDPPDNDGGSPVVGYFLYKAEDVGLFRIQARVEDGTAYFDNNVTNGTLYYYRVTAFSDVGEGGFTSFRTVVPTGPPSPPIDLQTEPGLGWVSMNWRSPANDGGSPVESYIVYRADTTGAFVVIATLEDDIHDFEDTDVTSGRTYIYRVSASNGVYEGAPSAKVEGVPFGAPGKPVDLSYSPADGRLVLSWSAPNATGGLPINGYLVHLYNVGTGAEKLLDALGPVNTYAVTGLVNGRVYRILVRATNGAGVGEPSVVDGVPVGLPSPPMDLVAGVEVDGVVLSWSPPADDGGSAITGYEILRSEHEGVFRHLTTTGNVTAFVDLDVRPGRTYKYIVKAINVVGQSEGTNVQAKIPKTEHALFEGGLAIGLLVAAVLATVSLVYLFRTKWSKRPN